MVDGEPVIYRVAAARYLLRRSTPRSDGVVLAVVGRVEGRRADSAGVGLPTAGEPVDLVRDGAADSRTARVGAALPGGAPCSRGRWGRPTPGRNRGTRSGAVSNRGESSRCPAVITGDPGFRSSPTARCGSVVTAPRGRPGPWPVGSTRTPPGGSFGDSPFSASARRPAAGGGTGRSPGPCPADGSRRGRPVRVRDRMPPIACRRVRIGGRPGFFPVSGDASSAARRSATRPPRGRGQARPTSSSTLGTRPIGRPSPRLPASPHPVLTTGSGRGK
ncbi:hypothetical protein SAMN02745673_01436 [Marinactinospora thermotolerans DSM 45154]|uniref:Uncharacterized protein n=1 Tax=Marinactinospora thermotolerans DSM 45154 TaxID=1122192 RepID=A0A1T4NGF9_9ACTN|nr:hypothetical protein SAMN02745673_01436 [Marinactinospora thermotolerans DSM 45154]